MSGLQYGQAPLGRLYQSDNSARMRDDRYVSPLEVPKKGGIEKLIIFHALGDMERHGEHRGYLILV